VLHEHRSCGKKTLVSSVTSMSGWNVGSILYSVGYIYFNFLVKIDIGWILLTIRSSNFLPTLLNLVISASHNTQWTSNRRRNLTLVASPSSIDKDFRMWNNINSSSTSKSVRFCWILRIPMTFFTKRVYQDFKGYPKFKGDSKLSVHGCSIAYESMTF
jgi:hypothetical protein